ncbi:MAG: hypothetical protein QXO58_06405 [Thermoplasmata archaeon]
MKTILVVPPPLLLIKSYIVSTFSPGMFMSTMNALIPFVLLDAEGSVIA